ncbi:MAG: Glu-tRNA(Gln) amidotransferase subunit GatD [Candidatus Aenigmatarchaeota archaeon]
MDYSLAVKKLLAKEKIEVGNRLSVEKDGKISEGVLMPNTGDPNVLVVKMDNGYNVGLAPEGIKIKKLAQPKRVIPKKMKYEHDESKKTILILHTGGTIASRIDYETGAVKPAIAPEDLVTSIPELLDIANIHTEIVFQMASDDMQSDHWMLLAKKIAQEYGRYDGIIITHGTDTIHYTSAALSFMLQNITKPVLIVGSQRSSDRGSSDAAMNLICAVQFIVKSGFSGVAVCMHANMDDDYCYVHSGLHVRKMHTSRRDAFRSIDVMPIAKVSKSGTVEFMSEYKKPSGEFKPVIMFNKKVALIKIYPGFSHRELESYEKNGYKGVVIEATGLGHVPMNATDKYTASHPLLLSVIKRMSKNGIVAITSQCLYGKVNLNVYAPQRKLHEAGVIPVQMTPETAFVKLGWVLGQTKNLEVAKNLMAENIMGEQIERIDPKAFLF